MQDQSPVKKSNKKKNLRDGQLRASVYSTNKPLEKLTEMSSAPTANLPQSRDNNMANSDLGELDKSLVKKSKFQHRRKNSNQGQNMEPSKVQIQVKHQDGSVKQRKINKRGGKKRISNGGM